METRSKPQAFLSSYAPRLRTYNNALLTPAPPQSAVPLQRTTKRGTTIKSYAEDQYDDLDDDDDDDRRRPTGLRTRQQDSNRLHDPLERVGKETIKPVDIQPIWREWMRKDSRFTRSDIQNAAQANLPLNMVPIRIDVDVPSYRPAAPFPSHHSVDATLPQYRIQEETVPYKLRDQFLWNLHETLITTDQFAATLVQD